MQRGVTEHHRMPTPAGRPCSVASELDGEPLGLRPPAEPLQIRIDVHAQRRGVGAMAATAEFDPARAEPSDNIRALGAAQAVEQMADQITAGGVPDQRGGSGLGLDPVPAAPVASGFRGLRPPDDAAVMLDLLADMLIVFAGARLG
jgi:hypothetical protein